MECAYCDHLQRELQRQTETSINETYYCDIYKKQIRNTLNTNGFEKLQECNL